MKPQNLKVRQVIKGFLIAAADGKLPVTPGLLHGPNHSAVSNPDILRRYSPDMEVQVNVSPTGAEPVEGRRNTWTKDGQTFWHIRVPKNAMSEPHWHDYALKWSLTHRAEAIGMTGWDWANKKSRWVAFDFDAITGHTAGLTDTHLDEILRKLSAVPWVEICKSTGGVGFHVYVFLEDGFPTANHNEHAILARAILNVLSKMTGTNLCDDVDVCGLNMWVWHRDAAPDAYKLVKAHTETLNPANVPSDWNKPIERIERDAPRHTVMADDWGQVQRQIIERCSAVFNSDHGCFLMHTFELAEACKELDVGFETISLGTNLGQHNCYCYLLPGDKIKVIRYGNTQEHESWKLSQNENVYFIINEQPLFDDVCETLAKTSAGYNASHDAAAKVAAKYGETLPALPDDRAVSVSRQSDGIIFKTSRTGNEQIEGWHPPSPTARCIEYFVKVEWDHADANDDVRVFRNRDKRIVELSYWDGSHHLTADRNIIVPAIAASRGVSEKEAKHVFGTACNESFLIQNVPFEPEWDLKNRVNNRSALRSCEPSPGAHPAHDNVLNQVGRYLTPYLKDIPWCREHGVDGPRYLLLWNAALQQHPEWHLPVLFLYSKLENTSGKSTFLNCVLGNQFKATSDANVRRGFVEISDALAERFNKKLLECVIGFVEETPLTPEQWFRLKKAVDAPTIPVRLMRNDGFDAPNYCHFVFTGNKEDMLAIPKRTDESRVLMIDVPPIAENKINRDGSLQDQLRRETPHFLHTLLNIKLPPRADRLFLPVPMTDLKAHVLDVDMPTPADDSFERFIDEQCVLGSGLQIEQGALKDHWLAFCKSREVKPTLTTAARMFSAFQKMKLQVVEKRAPDGKRSRLFIGISTTSPATDS